MVGLINTMRSTIEMALYKGEVDAQRRKAEAERERLIDELSRTQAKLEASLRSLQQHKAELAEQVRRRTAELTKTVTTLQQEIDEHARTTAALLRRETELQDANTALRVMLQKRDQEKEELTSGVLVHLNNLVGPSLEKLRRSGLTEKQQHLLQVMELNLKGVLSPFGEVLAGASLTKSELQIANLIIQRKTSKEIAEVLGISPRTVDTHRNNIRKKLGIQNERRSLRSQLLAS